MPEKSKNRPIIKVLNLYSGLGGNRKLWENVEVTAIEINPKIARTYKKFFPEDRVIVEDAHDYLLKNHKKYDFVWSSPPCQTHSRFRYMTTMMLDKIRRRKVVYADMKLYQEIILLQNYSAGKWVVENVIGYYEPLIKPQIISRHFIWANFIVSNNRDIPNEFNIKNGQRRKTFDLKGLDIGFRKDQSLNNCVEPKLGLHIFNMAFKDKQKGVADYAK